MAARLARDEGIATDQAEALVDRHGTEAPRILLRGRELDLLRPLVAGFPFLEAEVAWAVEHELALGLDDLLARRFRLAQELRDRGESIAPRVAAIAGPALGWDEARQAAEVRTYLEQAHREFDVPQPV
jgi:glycerol-3-phosphate dehydrogenase